MTLSTSYARGVAPGGVAPAPPGTLHARTVTGELRAAPRPGRAVRFGRGEKPEVDLGVGVDDQSVSRLHGELTCRQGMWWLRNTGQQLVRLPRGRMVHRSTDPVPLGAGYTPLFVKGSGYREHLIELYVSSDEDRKPGALRTAETIAPKIYPLNDDERLLLVVLGQRYLLYEEGPRPLTYASAAEELAYLRPEEHWNKRRIEFRIEGVRRRLQRTDFKYPLLHDTSQGRPADNTLLDNLIRGLVESTTLAPPDLKLIEDDPDGPGWPECAP